MLLHVLQGLIVLALVAAVIVVYDRFPTFKVDSRRAWRAHSPSGTVPLGHCTYDEALRRASRLGKVSYVDEPNGLMFYDTHLGGPPPDRDSGQV